MAVPPGVPTEISPDIPLKISYGDPSKTSQAALRKIFRASSSGNFFYYFLEIGNLPKGSFGFCLQKKYWPKVSSEVLRFYSGIFLSSPGVNSETHAFKNSLGKFFRASFGNSYESSYDNPFGNFCHNSFKNPLQSWFGCSFRTFSRFL